MMTIKEYAASRGCCYEMARRQVEQYADDLAGHISKQGRTRYLDDVAVAVLDKHRAPRPVAVVEGPQRAELDRLQNELLEAQRALLDAQSVIIGLQQQLAAAQQQKQLTERHGWLWSLIHGKE